MLQRLCMQAGCNRCCYDRPLACIDGGRRARPVHQQRPCGRPRQPLHSSVKLSLHGRHRREDTGSKTAVDPVVLAAR